MIKFSYSLLLLCLAGFEVFAAPLPDIPIGQNDKWRATFDCDAYALDKDRCYSSIYEDAGVRKVYIKMHGVGTNAGKEYYLGIKVNCRAGTLKDFHPYPADEFKTPPKGSLDASFVRGTCNL